MTPTEIKLHSFEQAVEHVTEHRGRSVTDSRGWAMLNALDYFDMICELETLRLKIKEHSPEADHIHRSDRYKQGWEEAKKEDADTIQRLQEDLAEALLLLKTTVKELRVERHTTCSEEIYGGMHDECYECGSPRGEPHNDGCLAEIIDALIQGV